MASSSSHRKQSKPAGRSASSRKKEDPIHLDLRAKKEHYSSAILLAKRKLLHHREAPMPRDLKPMLASVSKEAFDSEDWHFELKLDGYRALAYLNEKGAELRSRNNRSLNSSFSIVHDALQQWGINAVVDGEVVVTGEDGKPSFSLIQQWKEKGEGQIYYYVFDLLWLDGVDLREEPLYLRREILSSVMPEGGVIRFSDGIETDGRAFFHLVSKNGLEGMMAKKKDSIYEDGRRAATWLKVKADHEMEALICGYTKKKGSSRIFSSLVLGKHINGVLSYIGNVGTGFNVAMQKDLMQEFKSMETDKAPFTKQPSVSGEVVWLKPRLSCDIQYTEQTPDGLLRHPSFRGILQRMEEEVTTNENSRELYPAGNKEALVEMDGQELKLTNLQKIFWPRKRYTKGELLQYYYDVQEYIFPYLKDRPQSLNRYPNGIDGKSFYQKNMKDKTDTWLRTLPHYSNSGKEPKDLLICNNTATLMYMANLGCIEMNPWHSRIQSPHLPDWTVIDLDPGDIAFEKVIETALAVKELLDILSVPSFPKTSGNTGIHIYIPLGAKYNYEQSKQMAELIANLVHQELPSFTSLVRSPAKRVDKIYIDFLQNRPMQTICAPYSVRPVPAASVSTPLHWDEVRKGLKPENFTMKNILPRLRSEGDLFTGVLGKGIDLNKILKAVAGLLK